MTWRKNVAASVSRVKKMAVYSHILVHRLVHAVDERPRERQALRCCQRRRVRWLRRIDVHRVVQRVARKQAARRDCVVGGLRHWSRESEVFLDKRCREESEERGRKQVDQRNGQNQVRVHANGSSKAFDRVAEPRESPSEPATIGGDQSTVGGADVSKMSQ